MAILWALQAPVTSAPEGLGDLYGRKRAPPTGGPQESTRAVRLELALSRRPCRAAKPEQATVPAALERDRGGLER